MDARELIEAIEAAEYEPQSYSGRGMYGKRCVGFTTGDSLFTAGARLAAAVAGAGGDPADVANLSPSQDSMGYDTILYFRGIGWPDAVAGDAAA